MVATDVASRGIGMFINTQQQPLPSPITHHIPFQTPIPSPNPPFPSLPQPSRSNVATSSHHRVQDLPILGDFALTSRRSLACGIPAAFRVFDGLLLSWNLGSVCSKGVLHRMFLLFRISGSHGTSADSGHCS